MPNSMSRKSPAFIPSSVVCHRAWTTGLPDESSGRSQSPAACAVDSGSYSHELMLVPAFALFATVTLLLNSGRNCAPHPIGQVVPPSLAIVESPAIQTVSFPVAPPALPPPLPGAPPRAPPPPDVGGPPPAPPVKIRPPVPGPPAREPSPPVPLRPPLPLVPPVPIGAEPPVAPASAGAPPAPGAPPGPICAGLIYTSTRPRG